MIELLRQGRWFMIPLLTCSVVALAIIFDRWLYLRSASQEQDEVLGTIDDLVEEGDVDGIEEYCLDNPGLLSEIFLAGVRKFKQLREEPNLDFIQSEINKMMEDASILNTTDLERRLPLLSSVGNVAPLFGFAGTVTGMINAFQEIAATASPSAQDVASGIQEALVTTASGLLIAIPAVLFYNYFTAQIDSLSVRTEESANGLVDMLVMKAVESRRQAGSEGE
ncbi:MAG: MotA/TolQ/ExbB proton channel family protein [Planctomycetes bacterium]|nr:MotA/TolQ/ExbB proton channel family protein [Planctomycetota bacterium]